MKPARPPEFVRFALELLAPVGAVRARAMFGGFGVYRLDTMFAIIVGDTLYFKTDDVSRRQFLQLGLGPFTYVARGKTTTLNFHEAPPDALEAPEIMRRYALEAVAVALRARKREAPGVSSRKAAPGRRAH